MNRTRLVFPSFKIALVVLLFLGFVSTVYAADKDCWADFFDEAQYAGKHVRVEGASQFAELNNVQGENWDRRIHSLKVGPKAKLTVFQNQRFELSLAHMPKNRELMLAWGVTEQDIKEDSELIFLSNAKIHDLGDFGYHKKIRSLKVECV